MSTAKFETLEKPNKGITRKNRREDIITLRMPSALIKYLNYLAKSAGVSRSQLIRTIVVDAVNQYREATNYREDRDALNESISVIR
jgi:metal-responsive CopG/Arc/MetJ family transcriptional regulator